MASLAGRGAQVILEGIDQAAARGAMAATQEGNLAIKRARELAGLVADGSTVNGSTRTGAPAAEFGDGTSARFASSKPRFGQLGDSITAYGWGESAAALKLENRGWIHWANLLMRQAFDVQHANVFGFSGATSDFIVANGLARLLAADVDWVTILMGTNDLSDAVPLPYETTIANIRLATLENLALGRGVVLLTILPRVGRAKEIGRINRWITTFAAASPGVVLLDTTAALVDPATGGISAANSDDGLHPGPIGAYVIGKALKAALTPYLPPAASIWANPFDVYDATTNPTGNLLTNPTLAGTTGTLSGSAGVTGSMATGWNASASAVPSGPTGTAVVSKVARVDGLGSWQQATLTARKGSNSFFHYFDQSIGALTAGQSYDGYVEVEVDAGAVDLKGVGVFVREAAGTNMDYFAMDEYPNFAITDEAWSGVLRVPRFVARSGGTAATFRVIIYSNTLATGGCTCTVRFGMPALLAVPTI